MSDKKDQKEPEKVITVEKVEKIGVDVWEKRLPGSES